MLARLSGVIWPRSQATRLWERRGRWSKWQEAGGCTGGGGCNAWMGSAGLPEVRGV